MTVDAGFVRLLLGRMTLLVSALRAFVRELTVEVADDRRVAALYGLPPASFLVRFSAAPARPG